MVAPSEERASNISHKNEKKQSATKRPRRGTKKMSVYSVGGNSEGGGLIRPSMRRSFRRSFIVGGAEDGPGEDGKYHMQRKEKWRILKNIAAISFAFMMQFTAFQGTANLQSSINSKDGLGTASLCGVYAALVISCIFIPTFLIKQFTVKWTLCLSMLCYAPYIGAQFYPRFYTLVPTGILLGLGAAPMWAAKATYLTQVGGIYAKLTDQAIDAIIVRFFGFFFLAWQTAELWGNLISSLVLSGGAHGGGGGNHSTDALDECGAHFCVGGGHNNDNLERPPDSEIFEISAIYLSCVVIASAMVALLVDPLARYGEKQRGTVAGELTGFQLLAATFNQMKKPNQQMLIPLTVFIGLEQAFIGAEYTQAYVSCAIGIHNVGYVMVCFGVVNAICCLLFGSIMKYTGRAPLMALGAIVHAGIIVILLIWRPSPDHVWVFYGISGLWGIADSVWQTQMNGIYGALFRRNKEAAFSNYRLWESFGFVIGYAYSTYLCAAMKLYIMMVVLILGVIGYISVELLRTKKIERRRTLAEDPKAAAAAAAELARQNKVEETDDEIDDVDDEIVVEADDDEEEDADADVIPEEDEEVPKQGTNL